VPLGDPIAKNLEKYLLPAVLGYGRVTGQTGLENVCISIDFLIPVCPVTHVHTRVNQRFREDERLPFLFDF